MGTTARDRGIVKRKQLALSLDSIEARSVGDSRQRFFCALLIFCFVAGDIFLPLFHGERPCVEDCVSDFTFSCDMGAASKSTSDYLVTELRNA